MKRQGAKSLSIQVRDYLAQGLAQLCTRRSADLWVAQEARGCLKQATALDTGALAGLLLGGLLMGGLLMGG